MQSGANKHSFIHGIYVAKPCEADWNAMTGDAQVRFCGQCKLNVYNLTEMTTAEAEELIIEKEGKLCVRFYRRKDGTLLTKDCPRGLALARQKALRAVACASSVVALAAAWLLSHVAPQTKDAPVIRKMCALAEQAKETASSGSGTGYGGGASFEPEVLERGQMTMGAPPPPQNFESGKMMMGDVYTAPVQKTK